MNRKVMLFTNFVHRAFFTVNNVNKKREQIFKQSILSHLKFWTRELIELVKHVARRHQ